mmetsp:Transcript_168377/g.409252  ORF Transcript_168377/g.409252 Transcript_168377/m.409252 type:complete len:244 (+) Transcript_168377:850-1581(+)
MDLRIGVQITHALDVHHHQLVRAALECEVRERLWRLTVDVIDQSARVGVVLHVVADDEALRRHERLARTRRHHKVGCGHDVHLLWRVETVELFRPQLCDHLQLCILLVNILGTLLWLNVVLCHEIRRACPHHIIGLSRGFKPFQRISDRFSLPIIVQQPIQSCQRLRPAVPQRVHQVADVVVNVQFLCQPPGRLCAKTPQTDTHGDVAHMVEVVLREVALLCSVTLPHCPTRERLLFHLEQHL